MSFSQVQELEAEFEKLPSEKPQQSRFMRSQQDLKAKMEEKAAAASAGADGADGGDDAVGRRFCSFFHTLIGVVMELVCRFLLYFQTMDSGPIILYRINPTTKMSTNLSRHFYSHYKTSYQ